MAVSECQEEPAIVYPAMDAGEWPATSDQTANDSVSGATPEIRVLPATVHPAMDAGEEPA